MAVTGALEVPSGFEFFESGSDGAAAVRAFFGKVTFAD